MAHMFDDNNFATEVLEAKELVVVDFYADWCGPCKMMGPIIEEVATELKDLAKVGKLNVDNSPNTSAKYRVMSIPTILFIKNGAVVDTVVGALSKDNLIAKINQHK